MANTKTSKAKREQPAQTAVVLDDGTGVLVPVITHERFWIVIRANQTPMVAHVRHTSEMSAWNEAKRLADLHGGTFYVMECTQAVQRREFTQTAVMTDPKQSTDEEAPF